MRSVAETKKHIANAIAPRLDGFIKDAKKLAKDALSPLRDQRKAMRRHGYDEALMRKICHENWIRVLRASWNEPPA